MTVIAWAWIAIGVLMALGALMGALALFAMRQMGPPPPLPQDAVAVFVVMDFIVRHFEILLVAQGLIAVLAIRAGIGFLGSKAWSRTTLEVLSWCALAYFIGFGIFWIYGWLSMGPPSAKGALDDMGTFDLVGVVMAAVMIAVFAVPFGFMIRYLRGNVVRDAIASARPTQA